MDYVFGLPYARISHPPRDAKNPAYAMIRFSGEYHARCLAAVAFLSTYRSHEGPDYSETVHESIIREN